MAKILEWPSFDPDVVLTDFFSIAKRHEGCGVRFSSLVCGVSLIIKAHKKIFKGDHT